MNEVIDYEVIDLSTFSKQFSLFCIGPKSQIKSVPRRALQSEHNGNLFMTHNKTLVIRILFSFTNRMIILDIAPCVTLNVHSA